jgi:PPK2 family polyphosphate:nucleotide phosphotransferase
MKDDKNIFVKPGTKIKLSEYDTGYTADYSDKESAGEKLKNDIEKLAKLQYKLYASNQYSVLIVFQALDAAGKDGTIKQVMSGINPQGCEVTSFKAPTNEEVEHDFLWRCYKRLPERGKIGIFNRSYYEEVLVTRVHPELILNQKLPGINSVKDITDKLWQARFHQINKFEKHLYENGTVIIKFFLHLSKKEQKERFLKRIDDPEKNWKFSMNDIHERVYWEEYQKAYEDAIRNTSTEYASWFIIPADHKWFMRMAVGDIVVNTLSELDIRMPELKEEEKIQLEKAKEILMEEDK